MSRLKRKLTFLIVAAAVAASAAGAYAATQGSSTSPRQAFLNDVAHRLHVSPAQLRKAIDGAAADRLSALVAAGRLTRAQASAIEKRLSAGDLPAFRRYGLAFRPELRHGWYGQGFRAGLRHGWHGREFKPGLRHGWHGYAPPGMLPPMAMPVPGSKMPRTQMLPPAAALPPGVPPRGGRRAAVLPFPLLAAPGFGLLVPGGLRATVSYLGIRPARLMAELRAGRSLAQIATGQGKSVSGLEAAITFSIRARLDRQVAKHHLTRTEADRIAQALKARIAGVMNLRMRSFGLHRPGFAQPGTRHFQTKPHGAGTSDQRSLSAG